MARAKLVRAVGTFAANIDGVERLVQAGETLSATDPIVRARPSLFVPESPVEQTTAAPGEKRRR